MRRPIQLLLLACCLISASAVAADDPARGKLLVSTELVGGPAFQETVILILRYNDAGTLGLVINRRTVATPDELLPDMESVRQYDGPLCFGGPVQMHTVRGLLRAEDPPQNALPVFDNVYVAALDDSIFERFKDASSLRLYIGYSGWGPGQLEQELAEGSSTPTSTLCNVRGMEMADRLICAVRPNRSEDGNAWVR